MRKSPRHGDVESARNSLTFQPYVVCIRVSWVVSSAQLRRWSRQ